MEREKGESNSQTPVQPRLEAADGEQFAWPKATGQQEVSIFLRALGENTANKLDEAKQREQARTRMADLRQERRAKDPEGYLAEQAAKMRRYRETGSTKAPDTRDKSSR